MLTVAEALAVVRAHARPLPPRKVRLWEALGLRLAEDVRADLDLPPFDKALVDGFAVRSADVDVGGSSRLRLVGRAAAGHPFGGAIAGGEAVRIFTGAPLPPGADAVVVQEICGIHGDAETWKLISCLYGQFYLVVVNCDKESANFGKWQSFILSDQNRKQVLVPPKHGNGHLILTDTAIFHYKQNTYYNPAGQFTYRWNDEKLGIWWPVKNPIVSMRDEVGHFVA